MTPDSNPAPPYPSERNAQTFPVLDSAQIDRVAAHGKTRRVQRGEVLVEQGEETMRFFVVLSGRLEVLQSDGDGERIVATHDPGEFFGDVHLLSGRRSIVRARMAGDGEVLAPRRARRIVRVRLRAPAMARLVSTARNGRNASHAPRNETG